MYCCPRPRGTLAVDGLTRIDTSSAAVTPRLVEPEIRPDMALMFVEPMLALVARPRDPAAFDTVATEVSEEDHVTLVVRSCVELSV